MQVLDLGRFNDPLIQDSRDNQLFPSHRTCKRWKKLQRELGHFRACQRSGNNRAIILHSHDLILLALYRVVLPKATHTETNAFLYRANFGDRRFCFYGHSQISIAEKLIGLTTTKKQAQQHIRHTYHKMYRRGGSSGTCRILMV